jgi:hypothetical protein
MKNYTYIIIDRNDFVFLNMILGRIQKLLKSSQMYFSEDFLSFLFLLAEFYYF